MTLTESDDDEFNSWQANGFTTESILRITPAMADLDSIPTAYATVSIDTPFTPLPQKLNAIASAGFQGIELGFPDLISFASQIVSKEVSPYDYDVLCNAALEVKRKCEELKLKVVMLQPFSNFEGWKPQSEERKDAFKRVKGWIRVMETVGCDMLQVST